MQLIVLLVFLAVFAVVALLLMAAGRGSLPPERVRATLASALKRSRRHGEEIVDVRKNDSLSAIPWLHKVLAEIDVVIELRRTLDQADLNWTPARVLLTSAATGVVGAYAASLKLGLSPALILLGLVAASLPFVYVLRKRRKRFELFEKKLPDAIDLLATSLRAGNSTMGALGTLASEAPEPIRREFRLCFEEQNYGVDLRAALANLLGRAPLQDLRIIITAILIHKESGGNLAEVLEKTSSVIRDRFRLRDQIRVHTAQGRMTGVILALIPVILGTLLYILNPDYMKLLFDRPIGQKVLAAGVTLNVIGFMIIRKVVRIRI